jgi:hypothetical protein
MALVTVTGNAWDHSRKPIPADLQPRLFARPLDDRIAGSLLAGVSSRATLNATTGAFSIQVESDLDYRMWMDWLLPGQQDQRVEFQARDMAEWPVFNSAGGGPIGSLLPPNASGVIVAELGAPPASAQRMVWIDLTDVTSDGVRVYADGGS